MSEYSNALKAVKKKEKSLRTEIYVIIMNKTRWPAANSARLLSSMSSCAKKLSRRDDLKIILVFKIYRKQYIYKKIFYMPSKIWKTLYKFSLNNLREPAKNWFSVYVMYSYFIFFFLFIFFRYAMQSVYNISQLIKLAPTWCTLHICSLRNLTTLGCLLCCYAFDVFFSLFLCAIDFV